MRVALATQYRLEVDMVRYDLANGDSYIGEVVLVTGDLVMMRNYSAWYEGDDAPYHAHPEDEVSFRTDVNTRIEEF